MDSLYPSNANTGNATHYAAQAINDAVQMWKGIEGMHERGWTTYTVESYAVGVALSGIEALYNLLLARGAGQQAADVNRVLKEVGRELDAIREVDLLGQELNNEV